jgi:hypothetical protein
MNVETSAGAPAMQTETAARTNWPTRRREESLAAMWSPDVETIGSRVEGAAREGPTAPEVLPLALLALLALVGTGSMMLVLMIIL